MIDKYIHKQVTIEQLKRNLPNKSISRALDDAHTTRRPLPCGLTIHPGLGCNLRCAYCYIYDLGFSNEAKQYPLSESELLLAVMANPYFVPGEILLAIGSVTEPFLPQIKDKTLKYIRALAKFGNPLQFATKQFLDEQIVNKIKQACPRVSALVSVMSYKSKEAEKLEALVPSPEQRFESVSRLSRAGVKTYTFIRPVLQGITDIDAEDIMDASESAGSKGAIIGSLRISNSILSRLASAGYVLKGEIPSIPPKKQITYCDNETRSAVERAAERKGVRTFPAACAAAMDATGRACFACNRGPCGDVNKLPPTDKEEIESLASAMGLYCKVDKIGEDSISIHAIRTCKGTYDVFRLWVKWGLRRRVIYRKF